MSEQGPIKQDPAKQSLSEIGHLFLSSVRQQHTGRAAPPMRKGPAPIQESPLQEKPVEETAVRSPVTIDLTDEEMAQVTGPTKVPDAGEAAPPIPPLCAVIGAHLNDPHRPGVREYARHLAAGGQRIGLMEIDGSEFRLAVFDRSATESGMSAAAEEVAENTFDGAAMSAAIDELSWDLDQWLVAVPASRTHEARALLKEIDDWVLLSTTHPDGIVASYRIMKGLAGVGQPRLTLGLLDAGNAAEAEQVHRKLAGVAGQFLHWDIERGPSVRPAAGVVEHVVLWCRPAHDKAQAGSGGHWQVLADFLARAKVNAPTAVVHAAEPAVLRAPAAPVAMPAVAPIVGADEVVEVAHAGEGAVLDAVLSRAAGSLVDCPLRAPACPSARLTVTRERGLLLLAVARPGLNDLRAIALAYRWLLDNRSLIAMALPQVAIDAARRPGLRLLIDHADAGAEVLGPLIENSSVTLQIYRKLRWGAKTGLLLEAA